MTTTTKIETLARNDRQRLVRRKGRCYLVIQGLGWDCDYGAEEVYGPIPADRIARVIDQINDPDGDDPISGNGMVSKGCRLTDCDLGDYPACGYIGDLPWTRDLEEK